MPQEITKPTPLLKEDGSTVVGWASSNLLAVSYTHLPNKGKIKIGITHASLYSEFPGRLKI